MKFDPTPKDKRQADCVAKVRRDEAGAKAWAEKMRNGQHRLHHPRAVPNAYAYLCIYCNFWHVTSGERKVRQ